MPFEPLSWALGWALGRGASKTADWLGKEDLPDKLRNEVACWSADLPKEVRVVPDALFPDVLSDDQLADRPRLARLRSLLKTKEIPRIEMWHAALREHWRAVRNTLGPDAHPFFLISEDEAYPYLTELAEKIHAVCCEADDLFRVSVVNFHERNLRLHEDIVEQLKLLTTGRRQSPNDSPNQWRQLEMFRFLAPLSLPTGRAAAIFTETLVLALHDTFAVSRQKQFVSVLYCEYALVSDRATMSFELISHQLDFLAATRRRVLRLLETRDPLVAAGYEDELAVLVHDGWRLETNLTFPWHYHPLLFNYDARASVIAITDYRLSSGSRDASTLVTTSDQLEFMCRLIRGRELGRLADMNFDAMAHNPAALRFLGCVAGERGLDFGRLRIRVDDYETWDYLIPPL